MSLDFIWRRFRCYIHIPALVTDRPLFKSLLAHESWLKPLQWISSLLLLFLSYSFTVVSVCVCLSVCVWVCDWGGKRDKIRERGRGERERERRRWVSSQSKGNITQSSLCIIVIRFPMIAQLSHIAPGRTVFCGLSLSHKGSSLLSKKEELGY